MKRIPEHLMNGAHSDAFNRYVNNKYSKYGFSKIRAIEYNPEFNPNEDENTRRVIQRVGTRYRWVENVSRGLRYVGAAHDIVRIGHTGWFIDEFQDETIHGEVYQLPSRNGAPQYVPAVNDPNNDDYACLDFHSITDDKEDAARWADSMAEQWAEREREYQAEESRKQRLEEIEEEIKTEYADFRRITRELRANCDAVKGITVVRELIRDRWQRTKAHIRKLRREQHDLAA